MSYGHKAHKGIFKPKNPSKYKGKVDNIVYRSSWELRVMKWLDAHDQVIFWVSEELVIPYYSPVDEKMHRYFPDFVVRLKNNTGVEKTYVWEIKPYAQTQQPVKRKRTQKFINETVTYATNQSKWKAADIFCQKNGWEFVVLTEKELGIK